MPVWLKDTNDIQSHYPNFRPAYKEKSVPHKKKMYTLYGSAVINRSGIKLKARKYIEAIFFSCLSVTVIPLFIPAYRKKFSKLWKETTGEKNISIYVLSTHLPKANDPTEVDPNKLSSSSSSLNTEVFNKDAKKKFAPSKLGDLAERRANFAPYPIKVICPSVENDELELAFLPLLSFDHLQNLTKLSDDNGRISAMFPQAQVDLPAEKERFKALNSDLVKEKVESGKWDKEPNLLCLLSPDHLKGLKKLNDSTLRALFSPYDRGDRERIEQNIDTFAALNVELARDLIQSGRMNAHPEILINLSPEVLQSLTDDLPADTIGIMFPIPADIKTGFIPSDLRTKNPDDIAKSLNDAAAENKQRFYELNPAVRKNLHDSNAFQRSLHLKDWYKETPTS